MRKYLFAFMLLFALHCEANIPSHPTHPFVTEQEEPVKTSKIVYHGSPCNFERVEPHHSIRSKQGQIMWEGNAIFATHDYRIALFYTHNRNDDDNFLAGIDLISPIPSDTPNKRSLGFKLNSVVIYAITPLSASSSKV
jgi:hypothetical protein